MENIFDSKEFGNMILEQAEQLQKVQKVGYEQGFKDGYQAGKKAIIDEVKSMCEHND